MGGAIEDRVRQRAHEIWEREGRPEGQDQEHWRRAEQEVFAEAEAGRAPAEGGDAARGATAAKKPRARKPAGLAAETVGPAKRRGRPPRRTG